MNMVRKQFGSISSERVSKVKPFVKWAGGKGGIIKKLEAYFPDKFDTYFEPFVGGGAVFFHLNPPRAVINDLNRELMGVYEVVKNDVDALMAALDKQQEYVEDKEYFYKMRGKNPNRMTPINRAARTIFLNKTCFNGIYRVNAKGIFNVPFGDMNNPTLCERENLLECSKALKNTKILSEDYKALMPRIRKGDFVYLDPPYVPLSKTAHFTSYTRGGFGEEEQNELKEFCDSLDSSGARFLLNNSDTELVRDLYSSYNFSVVEAPRSLAASASSRKSVAEAVVTNF